MTLYGNLVYEKLNNVKLITSLMVFLTLTSIKITQAQNVGINGNGATPDASAILDVSAVPTNDKGILIPRIALSATNVAAPVTTPATSLLVYNTATAGVIPNNVVPGFYYWDGTAWIPIAGTNSDSWLTLGNTGTVSGTNFLGTTDAQNLDFRTNNIIRTRITTQGQIETLNTGLSVFIGESAGANDDLSANENVFVGFNSGNANTTGFSNVAVGINTLTLNSLRNTAIGWNTMRNTTGFSNVAVGESAMITNTIGFSNVAVGARAMLANTTGGHNVAIGFEALSALNPFLAVLGTDNIAIGYRACLTETTGIGSIGIGANTSFGNSTGAIAFGSSATATGLNATALGRGSSALASQAVAIGPSATNSVANSIQLGNTTVTSVSTYGSILPNVTATKDIGSATVTWRDVYSGRLLSRNGIATLPSFSFINDLNTGMYRAGADALAFSTAGTQRISINAVGNVGIGTATPLALLHLANGHIRSTQTVSPTISSPPVVPAGITAAALSANSTDVKGTITTIGTNAGITQIDVTFNTPYTVAPSISITPANLTAGLSSWYVTTTTTSFSLFFAGNIAIPSFYYMIIE